MQILLFLSVSLSPYSLLGFLGVEEHRQSIPKKRIIHSLADGLEQRKQELSKSGITGLSISGVECLLIDFLTAQGFTVPSHSTGPTSRRVIHIRTLIAKQEDENKIIQAHLKGIDHSYLSQYEQLISSVDFQDLMEATLHYDLLKKWQRKIEQRDFGSLPTAASLILCVHPRDLQHAYRFLDTTFEILKLLRSKRTMALTPEHESLTDIFDIFEKHQDNKNTTLELWGLPLLNKTQVYYSRQVVAVQWRYIAYGLSLIEQNLSRLQSSAKPETLPFKIIKQEIKRAQASYKIAAYFAENPRVQFTNPTQAREVFLSLHAALCRVPPYLGEQGIVYAFFERLMVDTYQYLTEATGRRTDVSFPGFLPEEHITPTTVEKIALQEAFTRREGIIAGEAAFIDIGDEFLSSKYRLRHIQAESNCEYVKQSIRLMHKKMEKRLKEREEKEAQEELGSLANELDQLNKGIETIQTRLAHLNEISSAALAKTHLAPFMQKRSELFQKIEELQKKLTFLKEEIEKANKEKQKIKDSLRIIRKSYLQAEEKIKHLQEKYKQETRQELQKQDELRKQESLHKELQQQILLAKSYQMVSGSRIENLLLKILQSNVSIPRQNILQVQDKAEQRLQRLCSKVCDETILSIKATLQSMDDTLHSLNAIARSSKTQGAFQLIEVPMRKHRENIAKMLPPEERSQKINHPLKLLEILPSLVYNAFVYHFIYEQPLENITAMFNEAPQIEQEASLKSSQASIRSIVTRMKQIGALQSHGLKEPTTSQDPSPLVELADKFNHTYQESSRIFERALDHIEKSLMKAY